MAVLAKTILSGYNDTIESYRSRDILRSLHYHGVTEISYRRFQHKPKLNSVLADLAKQSIAVEMIRASEIEQILRLLHRNKIDFLVFKGTALAYFNYMQPWQRPRSDTDILIAPESLDKVTKALDKLGYERQPGISGKYVSYQCTFSKPINDHVTHRVDVHWKINNRQILAESYTLDELFENCVSCTIKEQETFIPGLVDAVLLAAIHRTGHHAHKERLIWLYDLHLLCSELTPEQWRLLIARARKKQISEITFDAIANAYAMFDTRIERQVYRALKRKPDDPEPSAAFLNPDLSEWQLFWHDIKALPKLTQRIALIKEHLLPNKEYLLHMQKTRGQSSISLLVQRAINGYRRVVGRKMAASKTTAEK